MYFNYYTPFIYSLLKIITFVTSSALSRTSPPILFYSYTLFMERNCTIASLRVAITETDRVFKEKNFRLSDGNDFLR